MPAFTDIPLEVLLHSLRPVLSVRDVLALATTCKAFAPLAIDETFWKERVLQDFAFFNVASMQASGWRKIYERLDDPELFVWG